MKFTFFGVRGSYPVPNVEMMKYGGRTASLLITKEKNGKTIPLFIDAGIGIIEAGKTMFPGLFNGTMSKEFTLLFTHLHPDHTEGFTFFGPNFIPGVKMHLLGPSSLKKNVGIVLQNKMAPPTYPIEYKDLKSERVHGVVNDGQTFYINENGSPSDKPDNAIFKINVMVSFAPSHPQQGATYYRITDVDSSKSVSCIWDIESRTGGDQRVIQFATNSDAMIHDTQYTDEEYNSGKMIVQGFGHSTYEMAMENACRAGVPKLFAFHYNPTHTDQKLEEIISKYPSKIDAPEFILSREGMTYDTDTFNIYCLK